MKSRWYPGRVTINPNEVDITFRLPRREAEPLEMKIPILASAMDGVVDVRFAVAMNKLGGLAVLNLEGVQTRYKNPQKYCKKLSKPINPKSQRCCNEFTRNRSGRSNRGACASRSKTAAY
jgi:hypothetical protein